MFYSPLRAYALRTISRNCESHKEWTVLETGWAHCLERVLPMPHGKGRGLPRPMICGNPLSVLKRHANFAFANIYPSRSIEIAHTEAVRATISPTGGVEIKPGELVLKGAAFPAVSPRPNPPAALHDGANPLSGGSLVSKFLSDS